MSNRRGLLIVGHGTSQPRGQEEFWCLVRQVSQLLPHVPLEGAFLELAPPTIDAALQRLARRGAGSVCLMPLLLLAAGHAKHDIPAFAHAAASRHGLQLDLLPVLGDHPNLLALSNQQYQRLLDQHQLSPQQVLWIFVGRGAQDPHAAAQFQDFFQQRCQRWPVQHARYAFLAAAQPSLEDVWASAAEGPLPWVVVQPHLLLYGRLQQRLEKRVAQQDQASLRQRWLVAPHLGAHPLIADVVRQRYLAAPAEADQRGK